MVGTGNVQVGSALRQEKRWGVGARKRGGYEDVKLFMGGQYNGGGKRMIQKNGRNKWGRRARFKVVTISTKPRFRGVTV